ncbi:MAG: transcriptional regulator [Xanthomonadaceae bacterium]|nr:transcriptional regulator [Xanthomonadaceae bacterium]
MQLFARYLTLLALLVSAPSALGTERHAPPPEFAPGSGNAVTQADRIPPYRPRYGRTSPVVAVIAENSGTELVDFVIPYAVLAQSGAAHVVTVSTQAGPVKMRPALRIQTESTIDQFDARFPEGADYLIVPAMVKRDDPVLLTWILAQAGKGGTIVSICDGALVIANAGLLRNHRATAHWATQSLREKAYPDTKWLRNVRYVVDGKIVTSAGISAAIPTSLALVEAIAGRDVAAVVARQIGVDDWSTAHDSDQFLPKFGVNLTAFAATMMTNHWFHSTQSIGVPLAQGMDDIALAFTADAYSRTGRSQAFGLSVSSAPVGTRHGLTVLPDRVVGSPNPVDQVLPAFDAMPSSHMLDAALADIAARYGRSTAYGVALDFEYPGFRK